MQPRYLERYAKKNYPRQFITTLDGALKTVEKAKELGATVVNSLWLDEYFVKF